MPENQLLDKTYKNTLISKGSLTHPLEKDSHRMYKWIGVKVVEVIWRKNKMMMMMTSTADFMFRLDTYFNKF